MNIKQGEQWYLQWTKKGWTMIFTVNIRVELWYLQNINFKDLPPPHAHFNDSPSLTLINLGLFECLRTSGLKKVLHQREHTNLTPKWTFLIWAQIVAREVDGPSLQPSTWHLYTLLMPPTWIWRGCMWGGMASSRAAGAAWLAGLETSGPVDSWGGGW